MGRVDVGGPCKHGYKDYRSTGQAVSQWSRRAVFMACPRCGTVCVKLLLNGKLVGCTGKFGPWREWLDEANSQEGKTHPLLVGACIAAFIAVAAFLPTAFDHISAVLKGDVSREAALERASASRPEVIAAAGRLEDTFIDNLRARAGRVASVYWRMSVANAVACPGAEPRIGAFFPVPINTRWSQADPALVAKMYGGPHRAWAVASGSPAWVAGMRVGDEVVAVDGRRLVADENADEAVNAAEKALSPRSVRLTVSRGGTEVEFAPEAVVACPYALGVLPTPQMNARFSDAYRRGMVVLNTPFTAPDITDDVIAHVTGHEMAHGVLGHAKAASSTDALFGTDGMSEVRRGQELAADALGARFARVAGYAPAGADALFVAMSMSYPESIATGSNTHPSLAVRYAAIRETNPDALMPIPNKEPTMSLIAYAILAAILLSSGLDIWLTRRQMSAACVHRSAVPAGFTTEVSLEEHQKAADYTVANGNLSCLHRIFDVVNTPLWLLALLAPYHTAMVTMTPPGLVRSVAEVLGVMLIGNLLSLPFDAYDTFGIETRFGFNRATPRLWAADKAKIFALTTVIGGALLSGLFWLLDGASPLWWLYAWAGMMAFSIGAGLIYPTWIAPLFNKFEPLPEGELKERVEALLVRCGFTSGGLYTMDGSKRSTRGNAYFSGFGRTKRIVLFDTLLAKHSTEEIEAVLAHELGHFRLHHVPKRIVAAAIQTFLVFAALGWVLGQGGAVLTAQFGLPDDRGLAVVVAITALSPLMRLLSPFSNWYSRRAEFQADAYAAREVSPAPLATALTRLSRDGAATLTPDPIYAAFNYGHPPVPERVARLMTTA